MSDTDNSIVEIKIDDDFFFEKHGVGDYALEKNSENFSHLVDKSVATPNEKKFCRLIVEGMSQTEAYLKTFDEDGNMDRQVASSAASRLSKRKRVAAYRYKLMQKQDKLAEESLPNLIDELNKDRELARALGQPSAAINAVKAKANLLGLETERGSTNLTVNVLTDDTKKALLDRIGNRISNDVEDAEYKDVTPDE